MFRRRGAIFTPRKRGRGIRVVLLALLLVILASTVYNVIDNGRVIVRTQRIVVHNLPSELEGFTVLHISDLNGHRFGPGQKQLANALKARHYNAVCITGDMVGPKGDAYPFYETLSTLDASIPIYFISGDSDPIAVGGQQTGFYTVLADWIVGAQTRGATFLGEPAMLQVGNSRIWFSDAQQLLLDLDGASGAYAAASTPVSGYYADVLEKTRVARAQMRTEDLHIALTHNPIGSDTAQMMLNLVDDQGQSFVRTVDAFLAGGTVGGQWRIPFVGPVWYERWFPGDERVSGYQRAGTLPQSQYISTGLGTDAKNPLPAFRVFNVPTVTLITFTSHFDVEGS